MFRLEPACVTLYTVSGGCADYLWIVFGLPLSILLLNSLSFGTALFNYELLMQDIAGESWKVEVVLVQWISMLLLYFIRCIFNMT